MSVKVKPILSSVSLSPLLPHTHKYLDAYGETFALPECIFPVFIPVVFNNWPPAQD